jgi:hypothetical protein
LSPVWYFAIGGAAVVFVAAVLLWLRSRIRYVIGRSALRVMCLGLTLRRIPFTEIEKVSKAKRDAGWLETESWSNTWDIDHRELVVHRRSGWRRRVRITPQHRYAFRAELRAAIEKANGSMRLDDETESPDFASQS